MIVAVRDKHPSAWRTTLDLRGIKNAKTVKPIHNIPDQFFAKELPGETAPSRRTMESLYGLATRMYALRPWHVLKETELVLTRDPVTGETCYCSVMGVLGEVLGVHAYIGAESYRLFRRVAAGEVAGAGDFYETQHSVYLEFVPTAELDALDRKLLTAMGHPLRAAQASPIFRACRPGFYPWYVTEQEARLLAECMRAVIVMCSTVSAQSSRKYWDEFETYPQVTMEGNEAEPRYHVEIVAATLPKQSPLPPLRLGTEQMDRLRNRDYAIRGVLELDHFSSGAKIGTKSERKACVGVAVAVDGDSGFVFPPEMTAPGVSIADALGAAIIRAIETTRTLPKEVRVPSRRLKECLGPMSELCGFPVKVVRSLPALAEFREQMLRMF